MTRYCVCLRLAVLLAISGSYAGAQSFVSDDFTGSQLNGALWTFVDPNGNSSLQLSQGHILLSVPAGAPHDLWTAGNYSARILAGAPHGDFDFDAKFDSSVVSRYQMQGLLVQAAASTYIRFEVHSYGSSPKIFLALFTGSTPIILANRAVSAAASSILRISRRGTSYISSVSFDGISFNDVRPQSRTSPVSSASPCSTTTGRGTSPKIYSGTVPATISPSPMYRVTVFSIFSIQRTVSGATFLIPSNSLSGRDLRRLKGELTVGTWTRTFSRLIPYPLM
jgi:hypothetical protein